MFHAFALLGWLALLAAGGYTALGTLILSYFHAALGGRISPWVLLPLGVGACLVILALTHAPFAFVWR